ncbi:MAG: DUF4956 domain-containing protein [Oscillospiraceae bacterium]|nr:DUF4956 domain-containing protein [Oscillospiraceae bacterium]
MTFQDIFKSSFLENVKSFSVTDLIIGMIFAAVIGLFIFLNYKKTFSGVMYSTGFAMTLPGLTMVTTLVIMAVTSNVVLSLGMVGALSIVRFRTAIKEPMEIVYLFWSLAVGIVIGAGMIPLAVAGSAFIGLMLFVFSNRRSYMNPYIIVLTCRSLEAEEKAMSALNSLVERCVVKTKSVSSQGTEITAEIRLKNADTEFVHRLYELDGVENAVLVSYNGDYMS